MSIQSKIAILILAAGGSSRMGSPKQLLKWKGSNLINHTISKAIKLKAKDIFVILGANSDLIKSELDQNRVNVLFNRDWKKGLGSSISHGIKFILKSDPELEGILIMLVDQPLIEYDHYLKLINSFDSDSKAIIATKYSDDNLGVPALIDEFYFKELCDLNSDSGAKQLFVKYAQNVVSVANHKANFDLDTLDEYEQLYRANQP
ncbi:MAG: nucleotidyltransferase family protein [Flavobacteriaceae bacterium]|nr:nucleotidyltransferase family protein [Flavobacteriaceae bacterium]